MENEAPARWRKPPGTATPSTPGKRASPRLYRSVKQFCTGARMGTLQFRPFMKSSLTFDTDALKLQEGAEE